MKAILTLLLMSSLLCALEVELTNGDTLHGVCIHQSKGKITLKSNREVISLYKKSIYRVDTTIVKGMKKYSLPASEILKEKNDLIIRNRSGYPVYVKVRDKINRSIIGESAIEDNKDFALLVTDGEFYTTTRFDRPDSTFYITGKPLLFQTKEDKFDIQEFELGENKNFPFMKKFEREFLEQ